MKSWKKDEQFFARFFGYIGRNSLSGNNSKSGSTADNHPARHPDLPKGKLYIEVKRRKGDAWSRLWKKENVKAEKEGKTLVIGIVSQRDKFLFIRARDLKKVFKEYKQSLTVDMQEVIVRKKIKLHKMKKVSLT